MIRFNCDYSEGAHPLILERLSSTNFEQTAGYGDDPHCQKARELILKECGNPDADIYFLVGGTQTNTTIISAALRPWQGVLSADTGHINVHESGAIEATGHKVLAMPGTDGKISAKQIEEAYKAHYEDETQMHMVQPKMVYISQPTELGTLYSKAELEAISKVCREKGLYLFADGARMGYGLMSEKNDVTLKDMAELCDVFYIGGTKVGALFGEAVVITNNELKKDFPYMIKQKGGLLAKGRLLGIQFEVLFEDGLYYRISSHADKAADIIRQACEKRGLGFLCPSHTNQQFPIMPDTMIKALSEKYSYAEMGRIDENHSAIRFCTSWATKLEDAEALAKDIETIKY